MSLLSPQKASHNRRREGRTAPASPLPKLSRLCFQANQKGCGRCAEKLHRNPRIKCSQTGTVCCTGQQVQGEGGSTTGSLQKTPSSTSRPACSPVLDRDWTKRGKKEFKHFLYWISFFLSGEDPGATPPATRRPTCFKTLLLWRWTVSVSLHSSLLHQQAVAECLQRKAKLQAASMFFMTKDEKVN